ncbi:MAG: methylmalonyl-CoA mutase family protein [Candidatus Binatia bacterium]|jgi:methylmalonyl-CoA mutase, N-terminal domain
MKRQDDLEAIARAEEQWKHDVLEPRVKRFQLEKSPTRFYTPTATRDFDFLEKVGFPGQYPFTAGNNPFDFWRAYAEAGAKMGMRPEYGGSGAAGRYSGYGTAEDYRDYLLRMQSLGSRGGPNVAFDLVTQCGYDSDSPFAAGEVGRVGVAVDSFRDFQVIYEAFTGDRDIDRVPSNFTINAPAAVIIAMYAALAEKRGIAPAQLRGTPQNDILKEFIARGTYIYPPRPSMRLFRDTLVFCRKHMPKLNVTSIGGYHIREAGATRVQDLAFSLANGIAYLQAGVDAGLDIDDFAPMFTFNAFGGSMEIYHEIALQRAARRMWARTLKERFGAKDARSMMIRQPITAHIGCTSTTLQRPLNNLARAVVGGIASGMCGGLPAAYPPFDEPLGLGHSLESIQLQMDATRILIFEAKVADVVDPWAGSYFMESLTDETEAAAQAELDKIEAMGGAVAAIENSYMPRAVALSAYQRQRRIENQEDFMVGVNCFMGDNELDVSVQRVVDELYDAAHMATAEERQLAKLAQLRRERNGKAVAEGLAALEMHAKDEAVNLMPDLIECVKSEATLQEICDVLRGVFGEAEPVKV